MPLRCFLLERHRKMKIFPLFLIPFLSFQTDLFMCHWPLSQSTDGPSHPLNDICSKFQFLSHIRLLKILCNLIKNGFIVSYFLISYMSRMYFDQIHYLFPPPTPSHPSFLSQLSLLKSLNASVFLDVCPVTGAWVTFHKSHL